MGTLIGNVPTKLFLYSAYCENIWCFAVSYKAGLISETCACGGGAGTTLQARKLLHRVKTSLNDNKDIMFIILQTKLYS